MIRVRFLGVSSKGSRCNATQQVRHARRLQTKTCSSCMSQREDKMPKAEAEALMTRSCRVSSNKFKGPAQSSDDASINV